MRPQPSIITAYQSAAGEAVVEIVNVHPEQRLPMSLDTALEYAGRIVRAAREASAGHEGIAFAHPDSGEVQFLSADLAFPEPGRQVEVQP